MLSKTPVVFACCVGPQRFRVAGEHVVGVSLRTHVQPNPQRSVWTHAVCRRGAWVPLMDLRPYFGVADVVPSTVDHFLFVSVDEVVVGLVVDRVVELDDDDTEDGKAPPLALTRLVDVRAARACIGALESAGMP